MQRALIKLLIAAAKQRGIPIVVDPEFRHFFDYTGATVFKPNKRELLAAIGSGVDLRREEALAASPEAWSSAAVSLCIR